MLNPSFSKALIDFDDTRYTLPPKLAQLVFVRNQATATDQEFRQQQVYLSEIRLKLSSLGLKETTWTDRAILEVCCGTGFLFYHLLPHTNPRSIIFNDLSFSELYAAKQVIQTIDKTTTKTCYLQADSLNTGLPDNSFDIIIGNSFLHHFSDVGYALQEFYRLLKPGGIFVSLHEPTIGAVAIESGRWSSVLEYIFYGEQFIDSHRYAGDGIAPGAGTDVWLFKKDDMVRLLSEAGYQKVVIGNWHLLRPLVTSRFSLHLNRTKPRLTTVETAILRTAILCDAVLRLVLPAQFFGSLCLFGQKPSNKDTG